jgi:predicted GNAT superfamily acetyltransferase
MSALGLRDAAPSDFARICALNLGEVVHTSPMDEARLEVLASLSCWFRVGCTDGEVAAFLLAMRDGVRYENDNYQWFAARYPRFIYVDRVVVSPTCRGMGMGRLLYEELFQHARGVGIPSVACEYNIVPPNEPSRRFHDAFGFSQQGMQWLASGSKQVSLQVAPTTR